MKITLVDNLKIWSLIRCILLKTGKIMNKSKRMIGMAIPLLLIIGALVTIDLSVYFDGNSALIVVGGAFGFMIAADYNK